MTLRTTVAHVSVLAALAAGAGAAPDGQLRPWRAPPPAVVHGRAPEWRLAGEAVGQPLVRGGIVYTLTAHHTVVAADADTGRRRWESRTGEAGRITAGSLVIAAGSLVVAGDHDILAFDSGDGALGWRFTPDEGYGPGLYMGTRAGHLLLAGSPSGHLYAIDWRTGHLAWSRRIAGDGLTTVYAPVADDSLVVAAYTSFAVPHTGGLAAFRRDTGEPVWRRAFPAPKDPSWDSGWGGGPLLTETLVIAASADGPVHAFDRRTGALRWTLPKWSRPRPGPADPASRDMRPLARVGHRLYVGSLSGEVIAYDISGRRRELWRYESAWNGSIAFRLAADTGSVYIPYFDGCLVVVDQATGEERWRTGQRFRGFLWPPAVSADKVFVADLHQGLFAFAR